MNWLDALILGLVQGLTEFLPVSSSGHLELGKVLLNVEAESNITFTVVVHGATVLSTLLVFFREIIKLIKGSIQFRWNDESRYISMIFISMVPVFLVGLFLEEWVESFFTGNILFVGCMLIFTAILLSLTYFFRHRPQEKPITFTSAFIMGIAQALATLPGISRSGSTISTGLLLGNNRSKVAQFSFLMVLIPIIGANVLKIHQTAGSGLVGEFDWLPLLIGFLAAFFSGWFACAWMVNIVKRGKLIGFAIYCMIVGSLAIGIGLFT